LDVVRCPIRSFSDSDIFHDGLSEKRLHVEMRLDWPG
jgi:hypothetical protein